MSQTISAIYIKRAESFQTKEFISYIFETQNIGKVQQVQFISKTTDQGQPYNGAIVFFEKMCSNPKVEQMIEQMRSSPDGTTRYNYELRRFWFIKEHDPKPQAEPKPQVPVPVPESNRHPLDLDFQKMCQLEVKEQTEEAQRLAMENMRLNAENRRLVEENKRLQEQLKEFEDYKRLCNTKLALCEDDEEDLLTKKLGELRF